MSNVSYIFLVSMSNWTVREFCPFEAGKSKTADESKFLSKMSTTNVPRE